MQTVVLPTNSDANRASVEREDHGADADGLDCKTTDANELETTRKAVEDAAAVSAGLWISYLFMAFYLAVAAGAVTHADLLLENSVKLPFLGIELPLVAFFSMAPLLFLVAHAYTLVYFVLLGKKTVCFEHCLYALYPDTKTANISSVDDRRNHQIREHIRRQLPSNIFVQFLAGPREIRDSIFGQLLKSIAWVTLVFGPIALLLELQIQFLPYHHLRITWEHRLSLVLDLFLIWWLWGMIVDDNSRRERRGRRRAIAIALGLLVVWFSFSFAIIPGEWQERTTISPLYDFLFNGPIDPHSRRRASLWSNTLVLPHFNVYDVLKADDPQKLEWRKYLLSVAGRDLRGAVFDEALLERVDAKGAQLQGSSFFFANLQGASLDEANLKGASFLSSNLEGASLLRAKLAGADLTGVSIQGANLTSAQMQGASLFAATIDGANFRSADMRGTDLRRDPLTAGYIRGASFAGARLLGANFDNAKLDVVSFDKSFLWRTVFENTGSTNLVGTPVWEPLDGKATWGSKLYAALQNELDDVVPWSFREAALARIAGLDCNKNDPSISSCNPLNPAPDNVSTWQRKVASAGVEQAAYAKALASVYLHLICFGDRGALSVLRSLVSMGVPQAGGVAKPYGFLETGSEAKGLVESILDKKCRISSLLTSEDKARLYMVEQTASQP